MGQDRQFFLVGALVFAAVFAAGLGLFFLFLDRKKVRVRKRLGELSRLGVPEAVMEASILRDDTLSSVPVFDRILRRFSLAENSRSLIAQADVNMQVGTFVLITLVLALLGGLIATMGSHIWWAFPVGALAVGWIPYFVLYRKKEIRRRMFERQFPDALDLMTGALRSGMAFTAALQMVAEECPDPVSGEFRIVFEETRLGMSLRESFSELTKRIDSAELRLFVTAVLIQKETGGNLAEVLEGAAFVIRDRFRILGDVRTITAQARLSGLILTILPLGMCAALLVMAPDYLKTLIKDPVGPYLIGVAAFLQVVGFLFIRKIINVKV
jgi:tight adherence protein B